MKKKSLKAILILFIVSCDFSSSIHRDILDAQSFINSRQYDRAINKYQKILEKDPSDEVKLRTYLHLGDLYLLYVDMPKKARESYIQISKISDDPRWTINALEKIGEIDFVYNKNYRESKKTYEKLMSFRPKLKKYDLYEYRYALGLIFLEDYDLVAKVLENISKDLNHEYYIKSFYLKGKMFYHQKNWQKAIDVWKEYIVRERNQEQVIETKFLIANSYETMEKLKEAYNIYYSLLSEYPNPEIIKSRLKSLYERRVARKR